MKKSSVRARIRQLCCLGVPGELLMAPLLPALRELVPSSSSGFLWVDACGEVRNLYAERLPAFSNGAGRQRIDAGSAEDALRKSFLACAEAPDGIVATSIADGAGRAPCQSDPVKPENARYMLCAIVREQSAALGQLRFYRTAQAGAFGDRERADLASVMRYVAQGIACSGRRTSGDQLAFAYDTQEEAMIVTDALGTIRFASENGRRLLLLATAQEITPSSLASTLSEGAARAIKALCSRLEAAARGLEHAPPLITLDSRWGRFVMQGYRLRDGRRRDARIGLRIQRQVPMILRFVNEMGRQSLSPQQREIALQIALGRSNQEISGRMGVSLNTVAYHVKQLFLRLDVHTRTEVIEKIAWGRGEMETTLGRMTQ